MPKYKTHRASAKRFKKTANGGLKSATPIRHTVSTVRLRSNVVNCVELQ